MPTQTGLNGATSRSLASDAVSCLGEPQRDPEDVLIERSSLQCGMTCDRLCRHGSIAYLCNASAVHREGMPSGAPRPGTMLRAWEVLSSGSVPRARSRTSGSSCVQRCPAPVRHCRRRPTTKDCRCGTQRKPSPPIQAVSLAANLRLGDLGCFRTLYGRNCSPSMRSRSS